jgi:HEAT repeat protein
MNAAQLETLMNEDVPTLIEMLSLKDDNARYSAFQALLRLTETPVDWFGSYREVLVGKLADENSYQRSIAAMLLCNLAKSAKSGEFDAILDAMMPLADDENFITQRQYLQNIWKVAIADGAYRDRIVRQMIEEFNLSAARKHCNLLRLDILSTMIRIMRHEDAEDLRNAIGAMIDSETDEKSRKKYLKMLDEGM